MTHPELHDELVARAAADRECAEVFFAAVDTDERLGQELDALLASPATPLLAVLPAWDACPVEGARLVEVVGENASRLAALVSDHGWPGVSMVGAEGADAAWLLAQHADLENDLRRAWVGELADAVRATQADPRHLACLVDRIAVVDDLPQSYGTVAVLDDDDVGFPHPVQDPVGIDVRRAAIGLPSVAEDAALLRDGEIVPFGPDRQDHALMRWPVARA